ncbi:hypothetical protein PCO86_11530 [Pectobacteriaceae bacterium CE70]|nr:hypothetical protein PCO86_11530 [Pectobacteriaceae bacterium CE70]WJY08996.1 hypothetical protein PCO80_11390 [Pectobacteriaceae bacterium C80]
MLKESLHGLDYIGDIRGRGLFTGIEFVTDRYSMNPLTPPQHFASRLKAAGLEHGLLLYPGTPVRSMAPMGNICCLLPLLLPAMTSWR